MSAFDVDTFDVDRFNAELAKIQAADAKGEGTATAPVEEPPRPKQEEPRNPRVKRGWRFGR